MKLVIRHRAPRAFNPACRRLAQLVGEAHGPRGVGLRMRRPAKPAAPVARGSRLVDARSYIETRSARHLHFSQHLSLVLNLHAAATIAAPRPQGFGDVSPALRAQRHWRQAREWLRSAGTAPASSRFIERPRASTQAGGLSAAPIRWRRNAPAAAAPGARAPRAALPAGERGGTVAEAPVARTLTRLRLAKQQQVFQVAAEMPLRAAQLRHRAAAAIRDRAQPFIEAREQDRRSRHVAAVRPVSLHYRKATVGPSATERGMDLMHLAQAEFRPGSANAAAIPSAAATAARPSDASTPPRLDQRALDGLADDIIRRIDRRARVERERRGI